MQSAANLKMDIQRYLNETLNFYSKEWLQYLQNNKSYLISLIEDNGDLKELEEKGNPLLHVIAENILEINEDNIIQVAKTRGIASARTEYPIHMAWELFQSSRGIIWNAIKNYYAESQTKLDEEEFFELERRINDIIDLFIEAYTAQYVTYKDELLKSHRETVDELTVPIIPLADKVCILPIVGNVDTYRAKKIREKTLIRVSELKAQQLIIDISGVPFVDTAVVNHLFKIVKGIKLLGCSSIMTGISPEIADTMIELGIEIDNEIKTKSDLQQALQEIHLY